MKKMFLFALAFTSACVFNPPLPPPPQPPPVPVERSVQATIRGANNEAPVNTIVTLSIDIPGVSVECSIIVDVSRAKCVLDERFPHGEFGANLFVAASGYATANVRFILAGGDGVQSLDDVRLEPLSAGAGESGPLRVSGVRFLSHDRDWRYKGFTLFQALRQTCEGQNIDQQLDEAIADGYNTFRVLGMFKPYLGTFTLAVDDPARYNTCLLQMVRHIATKGARVQFTVFADAQEVMPGNTQQQAWFLSIQHLLATEWNVLGELCNECEKNGVDTSRFVRPSPNNRGLVLWSRGSGLGGGNPASPPWDYADYHERRGDEYPRYDECRPYMLDGQSPVKGVPCLQSEPMGASEIDQPGKRAGAINGDPTKAINDFRQMCANFALNGPGGLFHSDAGLMGGLMGPVQRQMSKACGMGLNFPPPAAHTWLFQRGDDCRGGCQNIGGMPLEQHDQYQLRTYCRGNGTTEWCVEIRPLRPPIPIAPWQIVEQPGLGLVRLTR